jgi:hypothetical protein
VPKKYSVIATESLQALIKERDELRNRIEQPSNGSDLQARLDRIAAMETPGANATVKRMARIARGDLQ